MTSVHGVVVVVDVVVAGVGRAPKAECAEESCVWKRKIAPIAWHCRYH